MTGRLAPGPKKVRRVAPAADLTGRWDAELTFIRGASAHQFYFEADGNRLSGSGRGHVAYGVNEQGGL